ncbi:hypothetical protein PEC301296_33800 [Pectobacterium carotovorum subsp. carotovorum]|nr:hypothetical protein GZ59_39850 [Pectobacterium atrosepticum]GKV87069.1 hypothetical protein PEC301296_33800 [Pectobacterium carotovorum subsp. carotovorum]
MTGGVSGVRAKVIFCDEYATPDIGQLKRRLPYVPRLLAEILPLRGAFGIIERLSSRQ